MVRNSSDTSDMLEALLYFFVPVVAVVVGGYVFLRQGYTFDIVTVVGSIIVAIGLLVVYYSTPIHRILDNLIVNVLVLFTISSVGYYLATIRPQFATFVLIGAGIGMLFYAIILNSVKIV